jgi:RimJ/RimL family protein N-acetyltransferase
MEKMRFNERIIQPGELLKGEKVSLRLVTLEDCTERYAAWLADPYVNRYLETRWTEQTLDMIKDFVTNMLNSPNNYLFAILENETFSHIGNIKIGPINPYHSYADISYFIGERSAWGKGYATDAIWLITNFGFRHLGLHYIEAGVYENNVASIRALEKVGYTLQGRLKSKIKGPQNWEDHLLYGILNEKLEV